MTIVYGSFLGEKIEECLERKLEFLPPAMGDLCRACLFFVDVNGNPWQY